MDGLVTGLTVALVGALFSLVAWVSPRATKKGRLLIELRQLGDARANLPDTDERNRLDNHIVQRIRALNEWLDPVNRVSRQVQSGISWASAILGTILAFTISPLVSDPWLRSATTAAIVIGAMVFGVVSMLTVERWAVGSAQRRKETAERHESLDRTASALGVDRDRRKP